MGMGPFAEYYRGAPHIAQTRLITAVVDNNERPERPAPASDAYARFGLTDGIWRQINGCWAADPTCRPTASALLQHLATVM